MLQLLKRRQVDSWEMKLSDSIPGSIFVDVAASLFLLSLHVRRASIVRIPSDTQLAQMKEQNMIAMRIIAIRNLE